MAKGGTSMTSSFDVPSDSEQIDFLFFVHDRHDGNEKAMHDYLEWEEGLPEQVGKDGDAFEIFKSRILE